MRLVIIAGVAFIAFVVTTPQTAAAPRVDRLDYLQPPQLLNCDERPFFRTVVNAVDAEGRPAGIDVTGTDPAKLFQVFERDREHRVVFVGTSASGGLAGWRGTFLLLLLDTSGSMQSRVAPGTTRFDAARSAIKRALTGFDGGMDHIAVIPFDSHDVVPRLRRAVFQTTRRGVEEQVNAIPLPKPINDTALYSAVVEALDLLRQRSDEGYAVSLIVLSDGENDTGVRHPEHHNDSGLLGDEGLAIVRERAARLRAPIITVGFGVGGNAKAQSAFKAIAWPTSDSYYDAATNGNRLSEIFEIARRRLADRIQVVFGPVREERGALTGQSVPFAIRFAPRSGIVTAGREAIWNAPGIGVPVADTACTTEEAEAIARVPAMPRRNWMRRLLVFGGLAALLAGLWFAAPRLVWPDRFVPRPTMSLPAAASIPAGDPRLPQPYLSVPAGLPRAMPSTDHTVFIPSATQTKANGHAARSGVRLAARDSGDDTVFIPPAKNPRGGH